MSFLNFFLYGVVFLLASVSKDNDLPQQAQTRGLNTKDHEKYGQQKCRPVTNSYTHEKLLDENVRGNGQADEEEA